MHYHCPISTHLWREVQKWTRKDIQPLYEETLTRQSRRRAKCVQIVMHVNEYVCRCVHSPLLVRCIRLYIKRRCAKKEDYVCANIWQVVIQKELIILSPFYFFFKYVYRFLLSLQNTMYQVTLLSFRGRLFV